MNILIDTDTYIALLENAIEDLREGRNMARVSELLQANWLEDKIDAVIGEEIKSKNYDIEHFDKSVSEQFEKYGIEKGGAVPSGKVSDETVLRKRVIYLKALKEIRR